MYSVREFILVSAEGRFFNVMWFVPESKNEKHFQNTVYP